MRLQQLALLPTAHEGFGGTAKLNWKGIPLDADVAELGFHLNALAIEETPGATEYIAIDELEPATKGFDNIPELLISVIPGLQFVGTDVKFNDSSCISAL